ncbi:MAG: DNA-protecting protein DprA [Oscillatoria sp. SIO1A7]|nr:DNA-protecting protein DprA [Oscillatoria sp. SIO1A7]
MEERIFWLAWSQISGVGPVALHRLQEHFGSLAEAWTASPTTLGTVQGFGSKTIAAVIEQRQSLKPEEIYQKHIQKNPNFWTPADPDYPRLLLEIPNPPPVLYYRGQIDLAENLGERSMIGIVGTRRPSEYGKRWTRRISGALAKSGFTIVSGMAAGIDTEAHLGCLEAGGRTLAIFGTHLDKVYPEQNRQLYHRIARQGAAFSEYPSGTITKRIHFPQRNRIIAGLSRAVLVMEAPQKSGSLITARVANEFARDVYVLPGRADDYSFQGSLRLLKNGAEVILNEGELLHMLGAITPVESPQQLSLFSDPPQASRDRNKQSSYPIPKVNKNPRKATEANSPPIPLERVEETVADALPNREADREANLEVNLRPELKKVLESIRLDAMPLDAIAEQAGLPAWSVSSALLELELLGLVSQLPGMRYQRCS